MTYLECTIAAQMNQMTNATYCVVSYQRINGTAPPTLMMITACPLSQAFNMTVPGRNAYWRSVMTPETGVIVEVHKIGTKQECNIDATSRMARAPVKPECMRWTVAARGTRLIACSNGQTYRDQSEAADALGVSQSAISQCLRGHMATVRGETLMYADQPEPYAGAVGLDGGMIDDEE